MGKQVKIDESALMTLITESVKKVLNERYLDIMDSGVADYKGTGSEESKKRMSKIRNKRQSGERKFTDPSITLPGNAPYTKHDKEGKPMHMDFNDSTWMHAQKSFGGMNGGSKVCDPVIQYAKELEKKNSEPLKVLARELKSVCRRWNYDYNKDRKEVKEN